MVNSAPRFKFLPMKVNLQMRSSPGCHSLCGDPVKAICTAWWSGSTSDVSTWNEAIGFGGRHISTKLEMGNECYVGRMHESLYIYIYVRAFDLPTLIDNHRQSVASMHTNKQNVYNFWIYCHQLLGHEFNTTNCPQYWSCSKRDSLAIVENSKTPDI